MGQFFKFLFASCLGTALALFLMFWIGFAVLVGIGKSATQKEAVSVKPNSVLDLDFKVDIPEKTNNTPLNPFDMEQEDVVGLQDMVKTLDKAKTDANIKGIYLNLTDLPAGKATAATLRKALLDFKSSGKFIIAYANYYSQDGYYIASAADSILLNPVGGVDFRGFASVIGYYKGMLDKMDVDMKIYYAGKFKSATEPFRADKMSPENRTQVREYINAMYDNFIRDIASSRRIPEDQLRRIADAYEGKNAAGALKSGLVDRIAYEDEAFDLIRSKLGIDKKDKLNRLSIEEYFKAKGKGTDFSSKDKIAVVYAEGTIMDGENGDPGDVYDGKYVKLLRKIRNDDKVKAVVLRINSPGGSVLASENIYREIELLKKAGKPVVVSMGDLAASGGYYIACLADSIFAEPNTLTGSIGVFAAFPHLQRTMKENIGITFDTVRTGKYSAFGTPFVQFSAEEDKLIQARIDETYEDFLNKVARGRKKNRDEVNEVAQGRVWTGQKALEIGLVDGIGGLDRAMAAAAKLAGIEKYRVTEFPRAQNGFEQFVEQFTKKKDRDEGIQSWVMRSQLQEMYPLYKTLQDIRRTKGIQARIPYDIIVK